MELKSKMTGIFEMLRREVLDADVPNEEKVKMLQKVFKLSTTKTNIMIAGSTGAGKSSTINALFNADQLAEARARGEDSIDYEEIAEIGCTADPETQDIDCYELGNLTLWDTPGLGDGKEADAIHTEHILEKLAETDEEGAPLIDLVLVILDASSKDLGTSYQLINEVIIPALNGDSGRILVALNQADVAMRGGQHWDYENNQPDSVLKDFLDDKVRSISDRIREATGLEVKPIYFCAGYKEEGEDQMPPYNLTKLLYYIVSRIPAEKRVAFVDVLNDDRSAWESDDGEEDYKRRLYNSIGDAVSECSDVCALAFKEVLGWPGWALGKVLGGVYGFFVGVVDAVAHG